MDTIPIEKRIALAAKRLTSILVSRLRLMFGKLLQLVLHDQLGDLSRQTQRLGSASVESVNYVGGELSAIDERLTKIEKELAALRELIDRSNDTSSESLVGDADDVATGPRSR
ncbi:MAG: hypothetical protein ACJ75Z_04555 [Solirubrobacterales bacterium]